MPLSKIVSELERIYPDRVVYKITENKALYLEINEERKARGLSLREYLESIGFTLRNGNKILSEQEISDRLCKLFPAKECKNMKSVMIDKLLYVSIQKHSKEYGLTPSKYLKSIGFTLRNGKELLSEKEIADKVYKLFPTREYENMQSVRDDKLLFASILDLSKEYGSTPGQYLEYLGVHKVDNHIIYDMYNFFKLRNEYDINESNFSDIMHCSRNNINLKNRKSPEENKNFWLKDLTEEEVLAVAARIEKDNILSFYSDDFSFFIADNRVNSMLPKALIMRNDETVKVCYQLPEPIQKILEDKMLDIFTIKELSIFDALEKQWLAEDKPMEGKLKSIFLDNNLKPLINSYAKRKGLSGISDYLALKDFCYSNRMKSMPEEEIVRRIKKHVVRGNVVKLRVSDEDYNFFSSRASRAGLSIDAYFASFGFYHESYHKTPEEKDEMHKAILNSRYKVVENKIYLQSYDPYYRTLHTLCKSRNLSINDYIEYLGFTRIFDTNELPEGYEPYDYLPDLENSRFLSEKKLVAALKLISNKSGQVYLDTTSYLYNLIFLKAKVMKTTISEVVEDLGFERTLDSSLIDDIQNKLNLANDYLSVDHSKMVKDYLHKLDDVEISYKEHKSEVTKIERNKTMVRLLKDMYNNECQLCSHEHHIPHIIKKDGEIYSEVHHIVGFHNAKSEDDLEEIDCYKNAIVLCPYHHKYLHLNQGGDYKLEKDPSGELYLCNQEGDRLKIETNYHIG